MHLLALSIADHPGATPHVLATISGHARENEDLAAAILTHPATPPHITRTWKTLFNLHRALRSPLTTSTTRARALTAATDARLFDLLTHRDVAADVHVEAHRRLTRIITPRRATFVTNGYSQLLAHPTVPGDIHFAAVHHLLTTHQPLDTGRLERLITHATNHPHHLADLAAARRAAGLDDHVAATLTEYATLAGTGTDPHALRLAILTDEARISGNWAKAIVSSGDHTIALEGLNVASPWRAGGAIRTTPELTGTAAWLRANTDEHAPPAAPASGSTYTDVDIALWNLTRLVIYDDFTTLSRLPTHTDAATIAAAVHELTRFLRPEPVSSPHRAAATRLALHPATSPADRAELAAALTRGTHTASHRTVARIAADPHPTHALWNTPLPDLTAGAEDPTVTHLLAHYLTPTLTPHLADDATLDVALAMADTFTGTLTDLFDVAATIAGETLPA